MSATQRNSIIFTTGCHSGLSVLDGAAPGSRLDFAQVLVGQGATYLANTGYGYDDADAIGYSERLMQRFTEELTQGQVVVGTALRRAKTTYFNDLGVRSLTPYHEKVLGVATFYGLPMIRLHLGAQVTAAAETVAPMLTARTGGRPIVRQVCTAVTSPSMCNMKNTVSRVSVATIRWPVRKPYRIHRNSRFNPVP